MTELLFQTDSYIREFRATVTAVAAGRAALALDRTAFYPGGGGQPNDVGLLRLAAGVDPGAGWKVARVKKEGAEVLHFLEVGTTADSGGAAPRRAGVPLPGVGTELHAELDWDLRYRLMRTHTAMHILCGVVWRDYGAQVTGGNMQPLEGRMDFEFENLGRELVAEIEAKINAEVEAERDVIVNILPRAEAERIPDLIRTKINLVPKAISEIRTIEIVGLDLQADGGTHVANTREVGPLEVVGYESKGRINKRIRIALDPSSDR